MTTDDALRFLAYEAAWCRQKHEHEALCLLLPALVRAHGLQPMTDDEARVFRAWFKEQLRRGS